MRSPPPAADLKLDRAIIDTSELVQHYFGMATHELTWSAFLREPTTIDAWLEKGDVVLKRRDGEALRVSRESRGTSERHALLTAARLLAAEASPSQRKAVASTVAARLPWTRFLPAADRTMFAAEFLSTLEACADLGEFAALGRLVDEWKNTAAAHAEGLASKLSRPVRGVGPRVERPRR